MRAKSVSITELPPSPDAERHSRMIKYAIAQGIRVLCIIAVFFVHGWWVLITAAGAVCLPYCAVVAANKGGIRSLLNELVASKLFSTR